MLVSACVIVKNEEKNLPRWIDCVKEIADEIIVVDTGSTDSTVKIAETAEVSLYHFQWINDFAAAKNFALSKAKGDWIVFLDADEYFEKTARKQIRPLLKKLSKDKSTIGISTPLLSIDTDNNDAPINEAMQTRIFRNTPFLKYTGAVHEYFYYSGDGPVSFVEYDFLILHTGYSSSIIDHKHKRNLELLLSEEKKAGENPEHYGYLALEYKARGDFKKAEMYIKKAINFMRPLNHAYLLTAYTLYINIKKDMGASTKEISAIIDDGLEAIPDHPDILAEKLILLLEAGDFDEGEKTARKIIEKSKDKHLRKAYINKTDAHLPYVHYSLGIILKSKGERNEAAREFKTALKSYRYRADIARELISLYEDEPSTAQKILLEIYDEKDDFEILENIFDKLPRNALYKKFCPRKKGSFDYALASGDITTAIKLAAANFDKALAESKQSADKENLKTAMYKLSIAFFFLPLEDLAKSEPELAKLPNSAVALILRYHGEALPYVPGETESFKALAPTAQIYLPKKLRDRFFSLR